MQYPFHSPQSFNPTSPLTHKHTQILLPDHPTPPVTSWPLRLSCCHRDKLISIQCGSWVVSAGQRDILLKFVLLVIHTPFPHIQHHTHTPSHSLSLSFVFLVCWLSSLFFNPSLSFCCTPFKKEKVW